MNITTIEALRALYPPAHERAVQKEIAFLDPHCRRFIQLSPFLVLATGDRLGHLDASPRGGAAGFVKVNAAGQILVPDAPGNNRLDSLENIIGTGRVGLIFMIPGINETLRANGTAVLSTAPEDTAPCTDERRTPKLVIKVTVEAAYLHCAKAFMRSRLWSADTQVARSALPTLSKMISDQSGLAFPDESQADMERRYLGIL